MGIEVSDVVSLAIVFGGLAWSVWNFRHTRRWQNRMAREQWIRQTEFRARMRSYSAANEDGYLRAMEALRHAESRLPRA